MASRELERLKQDMQDRPELSEKVSQLLRSAASPDEAATALAGLGYSVPAGEIVSAPSPQAVELDDETLDQVAGAGWKQFSFY